MGVRGLATAAGVEEEEEEDKVVQTFPKTMVAASGFLSVCMGAWVDGMT